MEKITLDKNSFLRSLKSVVENGIFYYHAVDKNVDHTFSSRIDILPNEKLKVFMNDGSKFNIQITEAE